MRILSGIQPSGILHIGNYFGMMRPAIALQAEGEAFYFVADYHALTSLKDPAALRENSRRVAIDFLACGLDPERGALFRQSDVPQVTELAWILTTDEGKQRSGETFHAPRHAKQHALVPGWPPLKPGKEPARDPAKEAAKAPGMESR